MTSLLASFLLRTQTGQNDSPFCWYCRSIFNELLEEDVETNSRIWEFLLSHFGSRATEKCQSVQGLRKGASNGCVACGVFLASITVEERNYASQNGRGCLLFNETIMENPEHKDDRIVNIVLQLPVRNNLHRSLFNRHVAATLTVHMDHGTIPNDLGPRYID